MTEGHTSRGMQAEMAVPGMSKTVRIDLGLAILETMEQVPGGRTRDDIALVCGCSDARIMQLEQRALRKLRGRVAGNDVLRELAGTIFTK